MAHLLFIASYAPSLIVFRGKLIEELFRRGHRVSAIATDASKSTLEDFERMGVHYYDIPLDRRGFNPLKDLVYFLKLLKTLKIINPDIVFSYTIKPVIYGSVAASFIKKTHISSMVTGLGYCFVDGTFFRKILKKITVKLYRISIKRNNLVFFQNPDDRNTFIENKLLSNNTKAVLVNGSGVDVNHFIPMPLPKELSFLMIARLLKEKGVIEYLQAAEIIKNKYPGIRFFLVGAFGKGTSFIAESELTAKVKMGVIEYLGVLKDVRPAIAKCSVYVLPSYAEGTPRTVLEAMAMGRPIITSDAPGCRETVTDGENGYLVQPRNVSKLVEAMERFIRYPDIALEFGKMSRKKAVNKYDVHKINEVIINNLVVRN